MTITNTFHTLDVLGDVGGERERQDNKWGPIRDFPDGTAEYDAVANANAAKDACEMAFREGRGTWAHIFKEEVAEALAESDVEALRTELIQVAAVAVAWVQALDRRSW